MRALHIVAVLGLLALVTGTSASAQQTACLAHDKLIAMLAERYEEHPASAGLEAGGRLVEVFTSKDGASWTMAMTTPDGMSCIMAVGEHWLAKKKLIEDTSL